MKRQILVPLKGRDHVEEIMPYLEDIAQPDTTIVFLIHFGTNRFTELAAQLLEIQSGMPAKFSSDAGSTQFILTHRVTRAGGELRDRSVNVEVKFYSGQLQRILRQCIEDGAIQTVIMRPRVNRARRWVQNLLAALRLAKPSPDIPVVLCHPSNIARRSL